MRINLPLELEKFVRLRVKGGSYLSESEVIADALRRLMEGDGLLGHVSSGRAYALPGDLLLTLGLRLGILKEQLSGVELSIREIMAQIEYVRRGEDTDQERIKEYQEELESVMRNVSKAAEAFGELLEATTLIR